MASFASRLVDAVRSKGNPVCVGLDPRLGSLPEACLESSQDLEAQARAYAKFCCQIIDVVAPMVPIVKPQAAFFEQLGPHGMVALGQVLNHARAQGVMTILDGKRNDIGSTAIAYAEGWLGESSAWGADSLTVSPYLGSDSLEPFSETAIQRDCGIFVLVKTSNPGGGYLQDVTLPEPEKHVYGRVARWVEEQSQNSSDNSGFGPVGAVVGATYPAQLKAMREAMPHVWLLVPGYGAQGGGAADVAGGFNELGLGGLINSSRGIIFAHQNEDYAEVARSDGWQGAVAEATRRMISDLHGVGIRPN